MKVLKVGLVVLIVLFIVSGIFLYKGDLSKEYVDDKYTNSQSQFLLMPNGARVHYRDEGDETRPAIVLVHGSNASLHTWEPWVAILGEHYRVISMDLPAHGLTGATADNNYSSEAQVSTVEAVVNHLNVSHFVLGGNSMGGGVTWRYTLQFPKKVTAMILVDSGGLPQFSREKVAALSDKEAGASVEQAKVERKDGPMIFALMRKSWFRALAQYLDPYWFTKQGLVSAYNNSPVVTDELIERYYELALREGSRVATLSRFANYGKRDVERVDPAMFSVPTLIMWGKEDALIPVSVAYQFSEALENDTLVIYDDIGHVPMEEIPGRSAKDVLAFLETVSL